MAGIQFSRQICAEDPNFIDVRIRMPRAPESAGLKQVYGDYEGEEAQFKVTKFILACACGMLTGMGIPHLPRAIESVARLLDEATCKDEAERRAGMN